MAKTYIPVAELPTTTTVTRKAGYEVLAETRQGIVEVVTDSAHAGWFSSYRRFVSVMTGTATVEWTTTLPTRDAVRQFQVDVSIRIAPTEPARLIGSAGYDFGPDIITEVSDQLRQISRRFGPVDVAELEHDMRRWSFNRRIVSEAFTIHYGAFSVKMDQAIASRLTKSDDAEASHSERMKDVERRMQLAQIVFQVLPDIPSRAAVAFDLANDPNRIGQYIEGIQKAYGEQQRLTIQKLEKVGEFFRQGNLDAVDLANLLGKVLEAPSRQSLMPSTPPKALPSN
ncbi:hypothetical protein [Bradyrhizobium sp. Cp5.3]|uniref:hypothetical protein n=1 Tax=Bradyrhizobium sp. Cp5.3 TaxID=443598 RepID=UPI0012ECA193|nr:hypothetical protein [Bradyrhizobium sp. Cp5.3]